MSVAFVLGNGTSRLAIDHTKLKSYGTVYGCNAIYRDFPPDYLIAVDPRMIIEINSSGYQHTNQVWTNYNKHYKDFTDFNYFEKSKGWSSGPTALDLASTHNHTVIYILGFDYKGLANGVKLNNVFANTPNYKTSNDNATYYGNWLKQTQNVIKNNEKTMYIRVIQPDNFVPEELNILKNLKHITIEEFENSYKTT